MKGDIYHILNRGIEKRNVFLNKGDYLRFVCNLYKLNNEGSALRIDVKNCFSNPPKQNKIVDILNWSLMPNHYHLLVKERIDGGAVEFAKRIGNGYTKYFNIKNDRKGYLFQNSAKIIHIKEDEHFLYLPFYIEANPVDLVESDWKVKGVKNISKTIKFLESYQWSSLRDNTGSPNFPGIINNKLFCELFETNPGRYKKDFLEFLSDVNLPG